MSVIRIISGGQTGVDRAALDAALERGIPCGGWCPLGRRAEDGPLPARYPLTETLSSKYVQRTLWNVRDSDGTLILHGGVLGNGTELTCRSARDQRKPLLVVDLTTDRVQAVAKIRTWLNENAVRVLNVAGPRASSAPEIYAMAKQMLGKVFQKLEPAVSRKGARRIADIPPDVLERLNAGTIEGRSLAEGLAVDFHLLLGNVLPAKREIPAAATIFPDTGVTRRMASAGRWLHSEFALKDWDHFAGHASDTVRGWAAYMLATSDLSLAKKLHQIRPLADDSHSGVREWAWLALRPAVAADLSGALAKLRLWTSSPSANVRRYASEITRPCGVWCAHLTELKTSPEAGRVILDPLRADPAKYVQDSVANWLNDASKSRPDWVEELCRDWLSESSSPATARICKRALRTLRK